MSSSPTITPPTQYHSENSLEKLDETSSLSSSLVTQCSTHQQSTSTTRSSSSSSSSAATAGAAAERGRSSIQLPFLFPSRLYDMLRDCDNDPDGMGTVASWLPDGKTFKVHNVKTFVETILPTYFNQSKYKSFQRQCTCVFFFFNRKRGKLDFIVR